MTGLASDIPRWIRTQRGRNFLAALLVYGVFGSVLLHGAFANFENLGGKDWNAFVGQAEASGTHRPSDITLAGWRVFSPL